MATSTCVVPLNIRLTRIADGSDYRRVSPATIMGAERPIVLNQEVMQEVVALNTPLCGYSLKPSPDLGENAVLVQTPYGGLVSISSLAMTYALANEQKPFSELELQWVFNGNVKFLATKEFIESGVVSVYVETDTGVGLEDLEIGEVYEVSHCAVENSYISNTPLRYIGAIGDGMDRRGVFLHPSRWLVQFRADTLFRPAKDKTVNALKISSIRRSELVMPVLKSALDALWFQDNSFSMNREELKLTEFSDEWCSYILGCLLIDGYVNVRPSGISEHTAERFLAFSKKDKIVFKIEAYRPIATLTDLFGAPKRNKGRGIYTVELGAQVDFKGEVGDQLEAFRALLQELVALKTTNTEEVEGLAVVHRALQLPVDAKGPGGGTYSLVREGYFPYAIK